MPIRIKLKRYKSKKLKGNIRLSLQNIGKNTLIFATKLKIKQKYYYNMVGNH